MNAGTVSRPRTAAEDFAGFVVLHARSLGRLAQLLVRGEQVADDLVTEVLLGAWREWPELTRGEQPEVFVRRALVERALRRERFSRREREMLHRLPGPGQARNAADVCPTLLRIPPGGRACLALRYALGLSEHEVADTLGVDVRTVRARIAGAVAQLRIEAGRGRPEPRPPGGTCAPTTADGAEWGRHVR